MKKKEIVERVDKVEKDIIEMAGRITDKFDRIELELERIIEAIHELQEKK